MAVELLRRFCLDYIRKMSLYSPTVLACHIFCLEMYECSVNIGPRFICFRSQIPYSNCYRYYYFPFTQHFIFATSFIYFILCNFK